MKISTISNFNKLNFSGSTSVNYSNMYKYNHNYNDNREPDRRKDFKPSPPVVEWTRRAILGTCVLFCINNELIRHDVFVPEDEKLQKKAKIEYFEDVSKLENKGAIYHLNRLGDIDNPHIDIGKNNYYNLVLPLDKNKKIKLNFQINNKNPNKISGYISTNKTKQTKFDAIFSADNPEEFKLVVRNGKKDTLTLGRKPNGELYKIAEGKKVSLNKENVKKYEQTLENAELLHKLKFFTNENDLWRKLQLILTMYFLLNEIAYETLKRRYIKENM